MSKLTELVLAQAGVQTFAGASHDDAWPDSELHGRFKHLFAKAHGATVVLVDGMSKHFVVTDMREVRSAHTNGWHGISEALIVPNDLFDKIKDELELVEPVST